MKRCVASHPKRGVLKKWSGYKLRRMYELCFRPGDETLHCIASNPPAVMQEQSRLEHDDGSASDASLSSFDLSGTAMESESDEEEQPRRRQNVSGVFFRTVSRVFKCIIGMSV